MVSSRRRSKRCWSMHNAQLILQFWCSFGNAVTAASACVGNGHVILARDVLLAQGPTGAPRHLLARNITGQIALSLVIHILIKSRFNEGSMVARCSRASAGLRGAGAAVHYGLGRMLRGDRGPAAHQGEYCHCGPRGSRLSTTRRDRKTSSYLHAARSRHR